MPTYNNPEEAVVAVRAATYPNSTVERETIQRVDHERWQILHDFDITLGASAERFIESADVDVDAANLAVELLSEEIVQPLANEFDLPDLIETNKRLSTLRSEAEAALRNLEQNIQRAEWHAARLEDVPGTYVQMVRAYPGMTDGRNSISF